jgi:hypothetical protein
MKGDRTAVSKDSLIELTAALHAQNTVSFDPDAAILEGHYTDELSLHRAKKVWKETLEYHFLLEDKHDFAFQIEGDISNSKYTLTCNFKSSCGRYAFWRLTNNQSPEAQYTLETAHIPNVESLHDLFLTAPDLGVKSPTRFIEIDESLPMVNLAQESLVGWFKSLLKK